MSRRQYPFHLIEPKWQARWDAEQTFRAFNPGEAVPDGHPFGARHGLAGRSASAAELPPKFYILDMFPYPSGAGLHVGHPEGYTATDILSRYRRACGRNVLHPMGWDSFGLPAEQYAVKTGQHPRVTTEANIANFTRQIKSLGFSYDWSREIATTDPEYFRWTQWIFLQLYNAWFNPETNRAEPISTLKYPAELEERAAGILPAPASAAGQPDHAKEACRRDAGSTLEARRRAYRDSKRLAYVSEAPVWWCPELGTVLANEEVIDGKSEVGGFPVIRRPMRQWMLRITAYAERLLTDLDTIDWSDSLKEMQCNWIGRSEGAEVVFKIEGSDKEIRVFTTRPDTLFGATFIVLAPEHPFAALQPEGIVPYEWPMHDGVLDITPNAYPSPSIGFPNRGSFKCDRPIEAVRMCKQWVSAKSEKDRGIGKEKCGVPTGAFAINPVTNKRIPIWIGDYVLSTYGTGAIMAVPAHDQRDLDFALEFGGLEVVSVVAPSITWLERHLIPPLGSVEFGGQISSFVSGKSELDLDNRLLQQGIVNISRKTRLKYDDVVELLRSCRAIRGEMPQQDEILLRDLYFRFPSFFSDGSNPLAFSGEGIAFVPVDLDESRLAINGLATVAAKESVTEWLGQNDHGWKTVNYKLRDWLFSRQRYWGEPFPIVWKKDTGGNLHHESLPENALPVLPPTLEDYKPTADGQPPLARAQDWVNLPDGSVRETNTMPQWAGSCWYYLRYLDAKNRSAFVSEEVERYWMGAAGSVSPSAPRPAGTAGPTLGIDLYVGGTEHAVLHLLYARFWHKVLYDLGHVSTPEPFFKLVNQGLILGEDGQKMSKSRGNVVNPDDVLKEFGADAFRLYEMFMGPLQDTKPWNTRGVEGVYRFLGRVWRLFVDEKSETAFEQAETMATAAQGHGELLDLILLDGAIQEVAATPAQLKALHACIRKVTDDLEGMRFNTAISAMMVFVNEANGWQARPFAVMRTFLQLLAPFAPHLAEELWARLHATFGQTPPSLSYAPWPVHDPALLVEDTLEIPVQVNGKLRDVIRVPADTDAAALEAAARANEKAAAFLAGKTVRKVIVVPRKLVNFVVA